MEGDDLDRAQIRAEWEQAWTQARHLEAKRGQWLAFFFTVVLGVAALAGPRLGADNSTSLLIVAALALGLEGFSAALYLAIVRLNAVHRSYEHIIRNIREVATPVASLDLSVYRLPPAPARGGRLGALATKRGMSRFIPLVGIWGFASVLVGNLMRTARAPGIPATTKVLCSMALEAGLVLAGLCIWVLRPDGSAPDDAQDDVANVDEPDR